MKKSLGAPTLGWLICVIVARLACAIGENNVTGVTGDWNGTINTAGSYDPYTGNAKRVVDDLAVTGSVGAYPLKWSRILNTRGPGGALGSGGSWTGSYSYGLWLREGNGNYISNQYEGPDGLLTFPDGREVILMTPDPFIWVPAQPGKEPMERLVYAGNRPGRNVRDYDLVMRDGGRMEFRADPPSGTGEKTYYKAIAVLDPYGQRTTIQYDSLGRTWRITEPGGRFLELAYQRFYGSSSSVYSDLIVAVRAYDGRGNLVETVAYNYTTVHYSGPVDMTFWNLTRVDYADGAQAFYDYYSPAEAGGNMWSTSPPRMKSCDDPRFAGPMKRIKYEYVVRDQNHFNAAWGQVAAERNLTTGQVVSQIEYPTANSTVAADPGWRIEHRPDGATRTFQYASRELAGFTDFLNHTSSIAYGNAPNSSNYQVLFTDALSHTTTTEKESVAGQPIRQTHPDGKYQGFAYEYVDAAPYYLQIKGDELLRNTYFTRDSNHRVSKVWYHYNGDPAAFPTEEFTYNNLGQVQTHKLTTGGTESFEYDNQPATAPATRGLKTKHTDALRNVTRYFYYSSGPHTDRLQRVEDPRGNSTWFEYNLRGQVTKVTHQDGTFTQNGYDLDGTLVWTADELGHTTTYTYDEYKRPLTVTNSLNQTTASSYAPWNGTGSLSHTTSSVYQTVSPMGKMVQFDYDANGRKTVMRVARGTADDAWTSWAYDAVGNLISVTDPRGNVTNYGYDTRNRQTSVTNALNQTTQIEYDAVSNKVRESRPDGAFRTWDYEVLNPMNRLCHAVDWRMSPAEPAITTTYTRDLPNGLVEHVIDAKGADYQFEFDLLHRKIKQSYPPAAGNANPTERFWYDAAGNLAEYQNPAGQLKHLRYDERNRQRHTWWDNAAGPDVVTNLDAASRMTSVTTNNGETTVGFGYDNANRKIWEEQTLAGYPTRRVETPVDPDGNRTSLNVPGYYTIRYDYTQRNQLAHIYGGGWEPWFNYSYDAAGNMTKRQAVMGGINDSLNVPTEWYDGLNRPTTWENTGANDVPFARSHYQYDNVGREAATWRDEQSSKGEKFWYTLNGQLAVAEYNADQVWTGNPSTWDRWVGYSYTSDMLNRTSVNDNGSITNYVVSPLNQYTAINGETIYHDANFNVSMHGGWFYYYDAQNRLTSVRDWTGALLLANTYDGLGRCVKRDRHDWGTFVELIAYDGWKPVVEWDGAGNLQAWNVYGPGADEILWRYEPGNGTATGHLRYHYDAHGNVTALLDWWGNVLEKYTSDVFGQPRITDGWDTGSKYPRTWSSYGNRFMFTGREYFPGLWLYDYRNRWYDAQFGRFLQTDPLGLQTEGEKLSAGQKALFFGGAAPEAFSRSEMNLYRYCGDDPVDRSDPTGLVDETWQRQMLLQGGGDGTVSEQTTTLRATAALDAAAGWAKSHGKEVAGTINSRGQVIEGPESKREPKNSDPGPVTRDTVAIWHLHLLLPKTAPYGFSQKDHMNYVDIYPKISHYVGVLNDAPGKFTIFAQTRETPWQHIVPGRLGPWPWPQPPPD
jgi:RHS repeat-associated protein